eukprot:TRINITY_DN3564_c0_g1_i3.p1 TRINITY_DN3564_c0_g1~~TRINITY_DN3564_c0_g1_i3.p1  ORF type:complete len:424 (+),score=91.11 TRINITY_DN3564_c0_g1_i3:119-1273(+)
MEPSQADRSPAPARSPTALSIDVEHQRLDSGDSGSDDEATGGRAETNFYYMDTPTRKEALRQVDDGDRQLLEESKVNHLRAVQRQQQVDESVGSLLRRLELLPGVEETAEADDDAAAAASLAHEEEEPGASWSAGAAAKPPFAEERQAVAAAASAADDDERRAAPAQSALPSRPREDGHGAFSGQPSSAAASAPALSPLPVFGGYDTAGSASDGLPAVAATPEFGAPAFSMEGEPSLRSLSLRESTSSDLWQGWTIQTTTDGRMFYYHSVTNTSQWHMPSELAPVLGEWVELECGSGSPSGPGTAEGAETYWRNERLNVSAWKDPRQTTNLFQAALDGNLFFLQLYAEVGGYLDAVDARGRTALHYNCAGGSVHALAWTRSWQR